MSSHFGFFHFKLTLSLLCLFYGLSIAIAQPQKKLVEVLVTPERADWTYQPGERVDFNVTVLLNGQTLPKAKVFYEIGPEQMPPVKKGEIVLENGQVKIEGISFNHAGFVRCKVNTEWKGYTYSSLGTAAFAPEKIEPTVKMPEDFVSFWTKGKEELASMPIDAQLTLMPEECTPEVNVYHVSLQNIKSPHSWRGASRFYGMLSVPKKQGNYPAILVVPGAGIRPYGRDDRAAKGIIVFKIGIHGIPVNLDNEVYQSLATGALAGYQNFQLDNRDEYYYKRVYLGCVRAIDFIFTLPEFDGESLAVTGGSQGGALSIITAGLDKRVKFLAAFYPALSDMTGYLEGRAGGWPHMFKNYDAKQHPRWVDNIAYYDVVNFARQLSVPGWYSWGYNDPVCPPTSMYAAYNVITSAKELHIFHQTEHWTFPEQREIANEWLFEKLSVKK